MARQVGRGEYKKAAGKREVSISNTQWKTGVAGAKGKAGRLVGPKGNFFTGTVKMQDGSKAVYKEGKRVEKKSAPATAGGGVTKAQADAARRQDKNKKTPPPPSDKPGKPPAGGSNATKAAMAGSKKQQAGRAALAQATAARTNRAQNAAASRLSGQQGSSASQQQSNGRRLNTDAAMPYQAAGAKSKLQKAQAEARKKQESKTTVQSFIGNLTAKPKKGATKETANSKMVWDGKQWVRTHIRKKGSSGRSYWVKL